MSTFKNNKRLRVLIFLGVVFLGIFFLQKYYRKYDKLIFKQYNPRSIKQKGARVTGNKQMSGIKRNKDNQTLKSFFNNKQDYEKAFAQCTEQGKINIIAGIVSHHFLAKNSMACFYQKIGDSSTENVILIGPDHFHTHFESSIDFFTTSKSWKTPYGDLTANREIIDEIKQYSHTQENDDAFLTEHSIYTEIPFIKKVFPQAKIIPLIIKNSSDYQHFLEEGKNLRNIVKKYDKTILLISSDFTHNSTNQEAKQKDKQSINILEKHNEDKIGQVACDCRSCLATLFGYLNNNSFVDDNGIQFKLFANKNSTDFGGEDKNVTSYVMGYYAQNN